MGFKVDTRHLTQTLRRARGRVTPQVINAMEDATGILGAEVRNNIPVDQGELLSSEWDGVTDIKPTEGTVTGKATMKKPGGSQLPYAWMREEGGTIVPKATNTRHMLAWMDKETGAWHFARKVVQKGSHYMKNALPATAGTIKGILQSAMTGLFDRFD